MWVPAVLAASTSPSPVKVPPVIDTVAFAKLRSSGSDTDAVGESASVLPSVNEALGATEVKVGGSLIAVMLTVVVASPLPTLKSSFTTQVIVRVGSEPKSVGLWLL